MSIESFVQLIVTDDRETTRLIDSWGIEKEELVRIVVQHFRELGIFHVYPLDHAQLIYQNIQYQLLNSPELKLRLAKIKEEAERLKARHTKNAD